MTIEQVKIADKQLEELFAVAYAPVVALTELIKNSSDACIEKNDTITIRVDTCHKCIIISDNGSGFCLNDIQSLSTIGRSDKMRDNNVLSAIDEPFAGSKGLGFFTAFNLCDRLQILTASQKDKQSYKIIWKKGTAQISYEPYPEWKKGTEITLYEVDEEILKLLIIIEELQKLYLSSIKYYIDNKNLPNIEFYEDNELINLFPKENINEIYKKNRSFKKNKGYFVSKCEFKYSKDKLILSYEGNDDAHIYNFSNETLDLKNLESIKKIFNKHKIPHPAVKDWFSELLLFGEEIDDFEGVYYIWREKKKDAIAYFPHGVRVYVNNYGMYDYLDLNNDWLQHTEISQNVKATNFKQKNTYGYVHFKNFNENESKLKISQERNNFKVNIAQKKFLSIMRNFVSGIFSRIDINIKNGNFSKNAIFEANKLEETTEQNKPIHFKSFINTNIKLKDINVDFEDNILISINNFGNISSNFPGKYRIVFSYGGKYISSILNVTATIPDFSLLKKEISLSEGESFKLIDNINNSSLEGIEISDILIESDDAIISNKIFSGKNLHGSYIIKYHSNITPTSHISKINVLATFSSEAKRLTKLFPNYNHVNTPEKIKAIIEGISYEYIRCPILCIIGLRVLLEISMKEFNVKYQYKSSDHFEEKDTNIHSLLSIILGNAFAPQSKIPNNIQNKYKKDLSGKAKQKLQERFKEVDLNIFVHNPAINITSIEIVQYIKYFKTFINFLIDSLIVE